MRIICCLMIFALGLAGCASQLERGWKNDDEGRKEEAIKNFSHALIDADETYRSIAIQELVRIGEPAVLPLTKVMARMGHYYDIYYGGARKEAALALAKIGSEEAIQTLLSSLKAAREAYKEEDLLFEIKELGSRTGLTKMVEDMAGRSDEDEVAVARIMEKYLEEIWREIRQVLGDEDNTYREEELAAARETIQGLPLKGEEGKKVKEKALEIVDNALKAKRTSGPPELIPSIKALGRIGSADAVELLLEMFKETYTKSEAALALARIGDERAIPYLKRTWAEEKDGEIKMTLEAALYLMGDETKWDLLIRRLKDGDLKSQAARLLGEIGEEKGTRPLIEVLSDESVRLRVEVIRALRRTGGEDAEEFLVGTLKDNEFEVKREAILSVSKSERSVEAIRNILQDEKEERRLRLACAGRLGEWGDRSGLALASEVVNDNRRRELSSANLVQSLASEEELRIVKELFSKKSFWERAPRTYDEEMVIDAIDRIGRAQDKDVRIGLRKLFREKVDVISEESQMQIIESMDTAKLRSILKAADEVGAARAKGEEISLKRLGEIFGIVQERDEKAEAEPLSEEAKAKLLRLREGLQKLEDQPAIKMLLERLLDLKERFSDEERAMAIVALGKIGEEEEVLREIYQDRRESYLMRFQARKALQMMGER